MYFVMYKNALKKSASSDVQPVSCVTSTAVRLLLLGVGGAHTHTQNHNQQPSSMSVHNYTGRWEQFWPYPNLT